MSTRETNSPDSDWLMWRQHVLASIERYEKNQRELFKKFDDLREDVIGSMKSEIATLKVKAGIWGLLGGLIPAMGIILVEFMFIYLKKQ